MNQPIRIICRTKDLDTGDVILQQVKGVNGGTVESCFEVINNHGTKNNHYRLTIENLKTGKVMRVEWPNVDHTLTAGPKVTAYRSNPALCVQARSTARPKWVGVSAKV